MQGGVRMIVKPKGCHDIYGKESKNDNEDEENHDFYIDNTGDEGTKGKV